MAPPNVMGRRLYFAVLLTDVVWVLISLVLAYVFRYGTQSPFSSGQPSYLEYGIAAAVALGVWISLFRRMRLDGFSDGWELPRVLSRILTSVLLLMVALTSTAFLARQLYSRLVLGYFAGLLLLGFVGTRCLTRLFIAARSKKSAQSRVVIMGSGHVAQEIAEKISRHPELMKKVVGFLYSSNDRPISLSSVARETSACADPPISTVGVVNLLRNKGVDEVVVAHPRISLSEIQKLLRMSREAGLRVSLVPEGYELYLSKASFLEVEGLPMLCLEDHRPRPTAALVKRIVDVGLSTLILLFASPVLIVGVISVMVSGNRPLRREVRCGLAGRPFWMWRINIDRDATDLSGVRLWLARLSLTELPQLANVILGNMSLVGPRPESPERVKHYSDWQRQRLSVKPGLTGLAQVHGLREQHSSQDKSRFDLQYLLHWSPFLDLSLVLQTVWTVAVRLWTPAKPRALQAYGSQHILTEVRDVNRSHASAN